MHPVPVQPVWAMGYPMLQYRCVLLMTATTVLWMGCGARIIVLHDPLPAEAHNDLGVQYMREGAYRAAERAFRRAIRKRPHWYRPYYNLGVLYALRHDWKHAFRAFRKATRRAPDCAECWNNLAWVALQWGRHLHAAMTWACRAVHAASGPRDRFYHTLARVALARHNCAAAHAAITAAILLAPPHRVVMYWTDYRTIRIQCPVRSTVRQPCENVLK